jgi:hypothetical protein
VPIDAARLARTALVALAASALTAAAILSVREDALPTWVPRELGSVTIGRGAISQLEVTRDQAVRYVESRVFLGRVTAERPAPDAFPVRVSGRVPPAQPTPLPPSGQLELRDIAANPAWLVAWRGIDPESGRAGDIDVVCLVDGKTVVFLYPCTFESLDE